MTVPTQSIALVREISESWEIVQIDDDLFELQFCDPCRYEWHSFYVAETVLECEEAYAAIQEGESPVSNAVWP